MNEKTGLAYKVAGGFAALGLVGMMMLDGIWSGLSFALLMIALGALAFVFLSKRLALRLVARIAPPSELAEIGEHLDVAVAEADLPTGPMAFIRLVWRLRKGIGPEVERLGEVVARLEERLDPGLDAD